MNVLAIEFQFNLVGIIALLLWFIVLCWLVSTVLTIIGVTRQENLSSTTNSELTHSDAPLVSILVPARNEEHRILAASLRSMLGQDYGNFEVIAIDDRSTDATGAILESVAKENPRLRVIHGKDLPHDWLGKSHAMQQALAQANGEWILATDADMIFERTALRTALNRLLENDGDAITLIPLFEALSFWERVMIPTWMWVFLMYKIFYRIDDPKSPGAVGIGGFFLAKRSVLRKLDVYASLKNEVMEDLRLAEMIKKSGARMLSANAPDLVRTRMYSNFREMWECSTKHWFSGVKFSFLFAMYCVVSMYSMSVIPPLAFVVAAVGLLMGLNDQLWLLLIPSAFSWLLQMINLALVSVRYGVSSLYSLTAPLGLALMYAMLFDSSIRITMGSGVTWKGRKIYARGGVRPPAL